MNVPRQFVEQPRVPPVPTMGVSTAQRMPPYGRVRGPDQPQIFVGNLPSDVKQTDVYEKLVRTDFLPFK